MQAARMCIGVQAWLSPKFNDFKQDGCCLPAVEETAALQVACRGSAALVERLQGEGRFQDAFAFAAAAGASINRSEDVRMPAVAVLATIKVGRAADGSVKRLCCTVSCYSVPYLH